MFLFSDDTAQFDEAASIRRWVSRSLRHKLNRGCAESLFSGAIFRGLCLGGGSPADTDRHAEDRPARERSPGKAKTGESVAWRVP